MKLRSHEKKKKNEEARIAKKTKPPGDNFIIYRFFTLKRYVCYEANFA